MPIWATENEIVLKIIDAQDGTPLERASVASTGIDVGGHTSSEGYIKLFIGDYNQVSFLVSHIGYASKKVKIPVGPSEIVVSLNPSTLKLSDIVITASRKKQIFSDAAVSINATHVEDFARLNTPTLDQALKNTSGVSQVGSQLSIRGSSGFSFGTGSRILMLMDGVPMMAADLGDIKWSAIPSEQIERIEMIKGGGSALYGTGALGGVINTITRRPSTKPSGAIKVYLGVYDQPAYISWRLQNRPMHMNGISAWYARTQGKTGWVLSGANQRSNGYHENGDYRRFHGYGKVRRDFRRGSYARLITHASIEENGVFLQWRDRDEPLRVPDTDRGAKTQAFRWRTHGDYYHVHSRDMGIRGRVAYYGTNFRNSPTAGGMSSNAHQFYSELQIDNTSVNDLKWTGGVVGNANLVRAPSNFLGSRNSVAFSIYSQGMWSITDYLDWTFGLRHDLHHRFRSPAALGGQCGDTREIKGQSNSQWNPQFAASFRPSTNTAIRASVGRGFRAPSASEAFAQAYATGVLVCSNPELIPERSWSYEIGVRQTVGDWGHFDIAVFNSWYGDLIEARPDGLQGGIAPIARFVNVLESRVSGLEAEARWVFFKNFHGRISYTFVDGTESWSKNVSQPLYCNAQNTEGKKIPLPYRAKHNGIIALEAKRGGSVYGLDLRGNSRFLRSSGLFSECGRDFISVYELGASMGRSVGAYKLNARLDNAFNYHFVLRERQLQPPRRLSLSLQRSL